MRFAHPNGDCLNIEKHEKDEKKRGDALRAEPTNEAGAEPNSFELCPARRRKTKSNLSKIYADAKGIIKNSCFSCFSMFLKTKMSDFNNYFRSTKQKKENYFLFLKILSA